ncbi:hypothetical protein MRS44_007273 [Fusarium solani]|uniref:uncharacterized protein n=1 Tax=Fusarium solani TaxID=169388 RepID=UPI0032C4238F|nr:hypothetical protein MRS44_007273 [Fusarium solani]
MNRYEGTRKRVDELGDGDGVSVFCSEEMVMEALTRARMEDVQDRTEEMTTKGTRRQDKEILKTSEHYVSFYGPYFCPDDPRNSPGVAGRSNATGFMARRWWLRGGTRSSRARGMAIDTGDSYYGYNEVNTLEERLRDMIPVSANVNALNTTNKHHDPTHVAPLDALDALDASSQHRSTKTTSHHHRQGMRSSSSQSTRPRTQ